VALALAHESPALRAQAVRTAAVLQLAAFDDRLAELAGTKEEPPAMRIEAFRAIVSRRPALEAGSVEFLVGRLSSADVLERLGASEVLRRAKLSDADLARTLRAM